MSNPNTMGSILRYENKAKELMQKQDQVMESLKKAKVEGIRPQSSMARTNLSSKASSLSIKRTEPIGNVQVDRSTRSNASAVSKQSTLSKKSNLSIKIDNALGT